MFYSFLAVEVGKRKDVLIFKNYFGRLAQLGERCVRIAEVEGSNPLLSTKREPDKFCLPLFAQIPLSAANRQAESGIWGCIGFDGDAEAG